MEHLQPYPHPLGVLPQFTAPQPTTLVMREKMMSLSGDSFHVKTEQGADVIIVQGKTFSISDRKEVFDPQGNLLFCIRHATFSIPSSYYLENPQGDKFLEVHGHFSFGGSKSTIKFTNTFNGEDVELKMKGNFLDSKVDITDSKTGLPVARIERKRWNARDLLGGQQTYHVHVASNVDMSIVAGLCICLDERAHESG